MLHSFEAFTHLQSPHVFAQCELPSGVAQLVAASHCPSRSSHHTRGHSPPAERKRSFPPSILLLQRSGTCLGKLN